MADSRVGKTALRLALAVPVMFAFAVFVMPPLYDVFCEVTGIGGKTGGPYVAETPAVDAERMVKVQFVTTNNGAMPWEFRPPAAEVRVHPGESTRVTFYARNPTRHDMVAQAIPSVTPANAAQYLHKTECFCFNRQPLRAGDDAHMPVVFFVDPELPEAVRTITLSYTLFDVTDRQAAEVAGVTN
jgi:cytochrome c oxidase assembly protein subunit 11